MAPKSRSKFLLKSNEFYVHKSKGSANTLRQTIALILLCFLSSGCGCPPGWECPWEFNNTCKQDHIKYGTRCDDEFQKILDENSFIIDNRTGKYFLN